MSAYTARLRQHWQMFRPNEYASMTDREEFFRRLGEQVQQQVTDLSLVLAGDDPGGESFLDKYGRLNMARLQAEEQVLRETLPPAESEQGSEDEPEESLEAMLAAQLPPLRP